MQILPKLLGSYRPLYFRRYNCGFTSANGSQTGASISIEGSTLEAEELECTTTSVLRCALMQAHISTYMHGISPYSGSSTEAVSWRCFMHVIDLLAFYLHFGKYGSGHHTTR